MTVTKLCQARKTRSFRYRRHGPPGQGRGCDGCDDVHVYTLHDTVYLTTGGICQGCRWRLIPALYLGDVWSIKLKNVNNAPVRVRNNRDMFLRSLCTLLCLLRYHASLRCRKQSQTQLVSWVFHQTVMVFCLLLLRR